jgi:hypothetical protein
LAKTVALPFFSVDSSAMRFPQVLMIFEKSTEKLRRLWAKQTFSHNRRGIPLRRMAVTVRTALASNSGSCQVASIQYYTND